MTKLEKYPWFANASLKEGYSSKAGEMGVTLMLAVWNDLAGEEGESRRSKKDTEGTAEEGVRVLKALGEYMVVVGLTIQIG